MPLKTYPAGEEDRAIGLQMHRLNVTSNKKGRKGDEGEVEEKRGEGEEAGRERRGEGYVHMKAAVIRVVEAVIVEN